MHILKRAVYGGEQGQTLMSHMRLSMAIPLNKTFGGFFTGFLEKQYCLTIIRFKMCQKEVQIIASPAFLRVVAH